MSPWLCDALRKLRIFQAGGGEFFANQQVWAEEQFSTCHQPAAGRVDKPAVGSAFLLRSSQRPASGRECAPTEAKGLDMGAEVGNHGSATIFVEEDAVLCESSHIAASGRDGPVLSLGVVSGEEVLDSVCAVFTAGTESAPA